MMMKRMKPEWKAKWCTALRSGKYKQGHTELYNANARTYCCLGVAQVVAGFPVDEKHQPSNGLMFPAAARAVGLPSVRALRFEETADRNPQRILAEMNDSQQSFAEIADWIEKHL